MVENSIHIELSKSKALASSTPSPRLSWKMSSDPKCNDFQDKQYPTHLHIVSYLACSCRCPWFLVFCDSFSFESTVVSEKCNRLKWTIATSISEWQEWSRNHQQERPRRKTSTPQQHKQTCTHTHTKKQKHQYTHTKTPAKQNTFTQRHSHNQNTSTTENTPAEQKHHTKSANKNTGRTKITIDKEHQQNKNMRAKNTSVQRWGPGDVPQVAKVPHLPRRMQRMPMINDKNDNDGIWQWVMMWQWVWQLFTFKKWEETRRSWFGLEGRKEWEGCISKNRNPTHRDVGKKTYSESWSNPKKTISSHLKPLETLSIGRGRGTSPWKNVSSKSAPECCCAERCSESCRSCCWCFLLCCYCCVVVWSLLGSGMPWCPVRTDQEWKKRTHVSSSLWCVWTCKPIWLPK